ncbi:hypothetical protein U7230_04185 [Carboxydochorda subterranea]|uniref:DUF4321 domain-containing protein n=1 Tax=Carboxydichorda subterranea TaxID=3109565 RepID=A0ABZ1BZZ9_9FIRM|nr:hypothetical protein [Limnochorda sp. L945t]WRP18213.1 hypothetical protein U7230_04185 [Limnochorda sp. L945t]
MIRPHPRGLRLGWLSLVLVVGAVIGSGLAQAASPYVPVLARSASLALRLDPLSLAGVLTLGFDFQLKVNLGTAIGIAVAAWLLRGH